MRVPGPEDRFCCEHDKQSKRPRHQSRIRVVTALPEDSGASQVEVQPAEDDICWICLDASRAECSLIQPCKCPRFAHPPCLARWQLQSAGTRRETHCEFCDGDLPDWKQALTPTCGSNAPAVMNVNFDGRTYSFEVKPGLDGYKQFTEAIRRAFNLPEDSELNITFTCDEPSTGTGPAVVPCAPSAGSLLTLQGAGAYDAAVHCASVSAARRQTQQQPPQPQPHRSSTGSPSSLRSALRMAEPDGSSFSAAAPPTPPQQSSQASGSSSAASSVSGDGSGPMHPLQKRNGWRKLKTICESLMTRNKQQ